MRLVKLVCVTCVILLASCSFNADPSVEEVSRFTSPDSKLDAVLLQLNFGATTPYAYRFYVVPKGEHPDYKKPNEFLLTNGIEGTSIEWSGPSELGIRCLPRTVYSWFNVVQVASTEVRIEIDSKCESSPQSK